MRLTTVAAAALLAASSLPAVAGAKSVPYAGVYAFNTCKIADKNSLTLYPNGMYRFGWVGGTWKREGDIIVVKWSIRRAYLKKVRTGAKSGVFRYRLVLLKNGRYALRSAKGGELMYRCGKAV